MKKITLLSLIFFFCLSFIVYAENYDDEINSLFKTIYYSGDESVKVLDLKYKKIGEEEYESRWEVSIKLKNNHKNNVYCQTYIIVTDKEGTPVSQGSKGSNNIAVLFNQNIKKFGVKEQTREINLNKKDIDKYFKNNYEFSIYTSCAPN